MCHLGSVPLTWGSNLLMWSPSFTLCPPFPGVPLGSWTLQHDRSKRIRSCRPLMVVSGPKMETSQSWDGLSPSILLSGLSSSAWSASLGSPCAAMCAEPLEALGTVWGLGPELLSFLISPGAQEAPSVPTLCAAPAPQIPASQTRQASPLPPPCHPWRWPYPESLVMEP